MERPGLQILLTAFYTGPQTRNSALGICVIRRGDVERLQRFRRRIDRRITDHVFGEELFRRFVAVGVIDIIGRLGHHFGTHDVVDEGMRVARVRRIGGDRHHVEPHS